MQRGRVFKSKRMNPIKLTLLGFMIVIMLGSIVFIIWSLNPPSPTPRALAALLQGDEATGSGSPWLHFEPDHDEKSTAIILYPGGHVDPRSYAPVARAISQDGYQVFIVSMPLNLAVLGVGKADDVIEAHPEIETWVIGGHSLGGAMAAKYALSHTKQIRALVLWASYPAASDDLRGSGLLVSSIYATRDGLTTLADIEESRSLLPSDTIWVEIEGGNHAQFGDYGIQGGDLQATIDRETQQAKIIDATVHVLISVGVEE